MGVMGEQVGEISSREFEHRSLKWRDFIEQVLCLEIELST